jgi:hypothetical protein
MQVREGRKVGLCFVLFVLPYLLPNRLKVYCVRHEFIVADGTGNRGIAYLEGTAFPGSTQHNMTCKNQHQA